VNLEFVGAVRLKKLLAGEFEPSSVKEKGSGFASSVSVGGIVKERGKSISMVCNDVASWFSIDEHAVKHPFMCGCFFQDITAIRGPLEWWVHVQCDGFCVKGKNVVAHWYASLQVCCFMFAVSQVHSFTGLSIYPCLESELYSHHQNGMGPIHQRRLWIP
jgi:hypothetical protein